MTLKIDLKVKLIKLEDDPYCPEQVLSKLFFCICLTDGEIWVGPVKWPTVYLRIKRQTKHL